MTDGAIMTLTGVKDTWQIGLFETVNDILATCQVAKCTPIL